VKGQLLPFYLVNMLSFSFLLFVVILYVLSTYILPKYPLLFSIRMSLVNNTQQIRIYSCILLFIVIKLLGELLQANLLSNSIESFKILLSTFVPVMIYSNIDTDKLQILKDTKGKTGVYIFIHKESGKNILVLLIIYHVD